MRSRLHTHTHTAGLFSRRGYNLKKKKMDSLYSSSIKCIYCWGKGGLCQALKNAERYGNWRRMFWFFSLSLFRWIRSEVWDLWKPIDHKKSIFLLIFRFVFHLMEWNDGPFLDTNESNPNRFSHTHKHLVRTSSWLFMFWIFFVFVLFLDHISI